MAQKEGCGGGHTSATYQTTTEFVGVFDAEGGGDTKVRVICKSLDFLTSTDSYPTVCMSSYFDYRYETQGLHLQTHHLFGNTI